MMGQSVTGGGQLQKRRSHIRRISFDITPSKLLTPFMVLHRPVRSHKFLFWWGKRRYCPSINDAGQVGIESVVGLDAWQTGREEELRCGLCVCIHVLRSTMSI
jgi:hypothetical protein